uniref:VWFA domain-containing protein n=1 Tax=Chromera velia CCMP2878 TaxID=1169474 RepID=A0A0G4FP71_9ALVE|eukprot:Cvel_18024.t1-p1 / transcript=Cvel_18024.t1 / gene=Cvel_18024 / organism=Chromera_velia_CCMP2878 / gene_product=Alpha-protein kinase vwkA, putative / transcript_product=Alpha-protein kinase vwkA, putative / location=Cvel_scaffold1471:9292-12133(-) / protein_length=530 / sequence_SO=supercontig / SO=protein_coding / is_pseudo=false
MAGSQTAAEFESRALDLQRQVEALIAEAGPPESETLQKAMKTLTATRDSLLKTRTKQKKERKHELAKLYQQLKDCNAVDLCFLVDCTNSMQSHLQGVKTRINRIVNCVQTSNPTLNLRAAFVGYRDVNLPKEKQLEKLDFTNDIEAFKKFVGDVHTLYGEDYAEDVTGGIHECSNLGWSNETAVVIHIGDAPCHGTRFHTLSNLGDQYPDSCPNGRNIIREVQNLLVREGMSYYFLRINAKTDKMIEEINKELPDELQIEMLDYESVEKLEDLVTTCIRSSIFRTFTATRDQGKAEKFIDLDSTVWSPEDLPTQEASLWIAPKKKNLAALMERTEFVRGTAASTPRGGKDPDPPQDSVTADMQVVKIKVAPRPFASGALRYCYRGFLQTGEKFEPYVFKELKSVADEDNCKISHQSNADESTIAAFLAELFNKKEGGRGPKILYKRAYIAEVEKPSEQEGVDTETVRYSRATTSRGKFREVLQQRRDLGRREFSPDPSRGNGISGQIEQNASSFISADAGCWEGSCLLYG